jgi:cell division protein FtsI/penicillin-binding protein 2
VAFPLAGWRISVKRVPLTQVKFRTRAWLLCASILFLFLGARLWTIQAADHERYRAEADNQRGRCWPILAPRGNIYDRDGDPLALNLKLFSIAADPALIDEPGQLAIRLEPLLRMPAREIERDLMPREGIRYVSLREGVDGAAAQAVRDLKCPGLIVSTEWRRVYPHRELAASLAGFIGRDRRGLSGIEFARDVDLAGSDGEMLVVLDGRLPRSRSQIPGRSVITTKMVPGSSVLLTIDLDLQAIAEEELGKAIERADAVGGAAIVMDPMSGEILALATHPGFDPNEFVRYPENTWVSHAVVSPYEPGSTFKTITACAALEEGLMDAGETYTCTGSRTVGQHSVSCAPHEGRRDHGEVNLDDMIIRSCNTGMLTVAIELGADRMRFWIRRFGFGERTGIEIPGESRGILPPSAKWPQIRLANVGFGQGISVTPLQLLAAYCAVANGGYRVRPYVVRGIMDPAGQIEPASVAKHERILSTATAERMRRALEHVIEEGTGGQAQIAGRRVAGKTGTAQKPTLSQGFGSGKYVASFIGFVPVDRPRLAVLVVVDEPKNGHYGGPVAGPAFKAICERALIVLGVPPDAPDRGLSLAQAISAR